MRFASLALITIAALTASIDTADARRIINCGPGMNSNGYACVPIARRYGYGGGYYRPHYAPRVYRHGYYGYGGGYGGNHIVGCGPGMNSDGYRCVPAGIRWRDWRY